MGFSDTFFFLSKGSQFCARPIKPSDKDFMQSGFSELSKRSRYLRFFNSISELSDTQLKYLTEIDGVKHVAWGILDESGEEPIPAGLGRFVRFEDEQDVAEVAITVVDSYQRKGLGLILFATLNIIAAQTGVKTLRYSVLSQNHFAINALKQFGVLNQRNEEQATIMDIGVIPNHQAISDDPTMHRFKVAMKEVEEKMGL